MKKILIPVLLILAALGGCIDDERGTNGPPAFQGIDGTPSFNNTQPASVAGLEHVARLLGHDGATPVPSGAGIWPFGDYVFGSGLGAGFWIADVTDPTNPALAYIAEEESTTSFARDADVVAHPDGRTTLVLATQTDGMHVWDVSDPYAPTFLARVEVDPNHNIAVIPGTELVLNSQSGGLGRTNELIDLSDPAAPQIVGAYGSHGCHDIAFWGSFGDDKFRAYCAGIQRTEIWDLGSLDTNATDFGIQLVATIDGADSPVVGNPAFAANPVRTLHHLSIVNEDASVLIIGDEHNGGGSPGTCFAYLDQLGLSTPFGALWFYDISDETAPELLSWISPPTEPPAAGQTSTPNCTAHFGTLVPGEEKLAMAWYSAGVLLIDFSDPAKPVIIDQYKPAGEGINTWDARIHNGYVFTGDIVRGMDVLRLV